MNESGIYVLSAVELASGQVVPTEALIVNAERNYNVHSWMMFPPSIAIPLLAAGASPTDVMHDFVLN